MGEILDTAFPVVVFDLDGTLLRGTTVSLLLAEWLGQAAEIAERAALGDMSERVRYVPLDFESDALQPALIDAGLDQSRRTCVLWEGVFGYLTPEAIDATLATLVEVCAPGSQILLTYVDQRFLDTASLQAGAWFAVVHNAGEPFQTGLDPNQAPSFFAERNLLCWATSQPRRRPAGSVRPRRIRSPTCTDWQRSISLQSARKRDWQVVGRTSLGRARDRIGLSGSPTGGDDMTDQLAGLLAEQARYYRERAGEYDDWWFRRERYDRGADANARWFADAAEVEDALASFQPAGQVLELACGTGLWTRRLARYADTVTAVDASPEVIELARAGLEDPKVRYVRADLFAWEPSASYDMCFFSFWLSHVPETKFEDFWAKVRRALRPGGTVFFVDSLPSDLSSAMDHRLPDRGDETMTRRLADGREFRIVKRFYEPHELNQRLADLGWDAQVQATREFFIHGQATRASERVEADRG
jgi:O-methyltransferase involved in polyketide biosynthesis